MSDSRREQLDQAARDIDVDALRQAAQRVGGTTGRLMEQVAEAARAPEPGAALAEVLSQLDGPEDVFGQAMPVVEGQLKALDVRLRQMQDAANALAAVQASLQKGLVEVSEEGFDPEVRALLDDTLAEARVVDVAELQLLTLDLEALTGELQDAFAAARRREATDLPDFEARSERIRQVLARSAPNFPRMQELLARAATLAQERGNPGWLRLSLMSVRFGQDLLGAEHPEVQAAWFALLQDAIAESDAEVAWTAGKSVQAVYIDAQDWVSVAQIASDVAALHKPGETREILARLEQALAMVKVEALREQAIELTSVALEHAKPTAVWTRALLMAGQVMEQAGDDEGARRLFGRCLMDGKEAGPVGVVGRAALHLGRSQRHHQPAQAGRALKLAFTISRNTGDWMLFVNTAPVLVRYLKDQGDDAAARQVVDESVRMAATAGRESYVAELLASA